MILAATQKNCEKGCNRTFTSTVLPTGVDIGRLDSIENTKKRCETALGLFNLLCPSLGRALTSIKVRSVQRRGCPRSLLLRAMARLAEALSISLGDRSYNVVFRRRGVVWLITISISYLNVSLP